MKLLLTNNVIDAFRATAAKSITVKPIAVKSIVISALTLALATGSQYGFASEQATSLKTPPETSVLSTEVLYLQPSVKSLTVTGISDIEQNRKLASLLPKIGELNNAEQFIVLQAQGEQLWRQQKFKLANGLFEELEQRAQQLSEHQRAQAEFIDYLRIWSKVLQEQKSLENAFETKRRYLRAYSKAYAKIRKQEIALLNEKYETSKKETANRLLEKRSETTRLKIAEVEKEKAFYQRNKFILMAVFIAFIVMLIRQVTISRRLKNLSKKDQLTGCNSRRQLFLKGQRLVEHFERTGNSFCLVMFDIDNFKAFNETFSHDQGDGILKQLTNIAKYTLRSRDILARIGSEEFVILLPSATLVQTQAIAQRIKDKAQQEADISLSVGIVCIEQTQGTLNSALQAADAARRHAKQAGGNKVVSFLSMNKES